MEDNINIPKIYFDVVYSIYAIGWITDLDKTIKNAGFSSRYYADSASTASPSIDTIEPSMSFTSTQAVSILNSQLLI